MRHIRRLARSYPQGERGRLIADAFGAFSLFALLYAALHLPLFF